MGRMAVYGFSHELWESHLYYTREGMKKIMGRWMRDFPDGFYIQVQPYSKTQDKKPPKIRLEIVKPITRPPAIYDNNHSLYEK